MQLLREAQKVSMAKCDFCTVSALRSDKPTSRSHQCQDAHDSTRAAWPRAWSKEFELSSLHFSILEIISCFPILLKDRRTIPEKYSREPLFSHVPTSLNVYCLPERHKLQHLAINQTYTTHPFWPQTAMSGSCHPAHVGLPCFGTRQWCWGVVLESLIWFWVWEFLHGPYSCHIFSFFEKSVHLRQPQLVCMSTFWKTLKWHQSNTPLTSKFYTLSRFPPLRIRNFPHPVLWLMVCRPGALTHSTLSKHVLTSLQSLHSTSRPSRPSRRQLCWNQGGAAVAHVELACVNGNGVTLRTGRGRKNSWFLEVQERMMLLVYTFSVKPHSVWTLQ